MAWRYATSDVTEEIAVDHVLAVGAGNLQQAIVEHQHLNISWLALGIDQSDYPLFEIGDAYLWLLLRGKRNPEQNCGAKNL